MGEGAVRFIQVNCPDESINPRWDQHSNMPQHAVHARASDKPGAGLLQDLKQRGLLEVRFRGRVGHRSPRGRSCL